MRGFIIGIMNGYGYLGIGLLIVLENIFPPIPSELILTFGGFMTTYSDMSVPGVIAAATAGSVAGAFLLYGLGSLMSPKRLEKLLDSRVCRHLGFKKKEIKGTLQWFEEHGKNAVFLGRCVPIIRSLISIPAGMSGMSLPLFCLYTTAGSLIWDTVLVGLGSVAGASWEKITEYLSAYSSLTMIVLSTAAVTFLLYCLRKRMGKKRGKQASGKYKIKIPE